jgi:circadian clock protein KaiC
LHITKVRGRKFRSGYHDFAIVTGGIELFPRVVLSQHAQPHPYRYLSSGIPELDALLGGGVDYATTTLILGPAGSGKSTVAIQYALAAIGRGERAALFVFDERLNTIFERTRALGTDIAPHVASGALLVREVDPAELSAGEFAHRVQEVIVETGCRLVVIDSLNGYLHALSDESQLSVQLHELLAYLGNTGVATLMVMAQHGLTGTMQSPVDVSYLADTLLLLRHFEADGRIRKAISVLKKRSGPHEDTIREFTISSRGIHVGAVLRQFTGVLTGVPKYIGDPTKLKSGD